MAVEDMQADRADEPNRPDPPSVSAADIQNTVTAATLGTAVQAHTISGGIHHHVASSRRPVPRQLPAIPTSFIGRTPELATLTSALNQGPGGAVVISALAGTGGIGKTWLVLQWAHQHRDRFPDGQLFVDLRGFLPCR
jgi:hypothetical protein